MTDASRPADPDVPTLVTRRWARILNHYAALHELVRP